LAGDTMWGIEQQKGESYLEVAGEDRGQEAKSNRGKGIRRREISPRLIRWVKVSRKELGKVQKGENCP